MEADKKGVPTGSDNNYACMGLNSTPIAKNPAITPDSDKVILHIDKNKCAYRLLSLACPCSPLCFRTLDLDGQY